jgi:ribonuclease P protein component
MRLRRGRDFERAYREGSRARGGILVVVAVENGGPWSRVGLSVGRKVWRGAVQRNRVRRVFREAFRVSYGELPQGVDLVLIAAEPRLRPKLGPTSEELVKLAHKAHRRYLEKAAAREAAAQADRA